MEAVGITDTDGEEDQRPPKTAAADDSVKAAGAADGDAVGDDY